MAAKMGGFRSPNGVRKPQLKGAGMGGKSMVDPMASMGAMPGMPGMKKGGMVKKKKGKGKK